jgi:hypothetical protein
VAIELVSLRFEELDADDGKLDLYDASISNYGLARTIAIVGHYYQTGKIIAHAPRSEVRVYIYAPENGSFILSIGAAVLATVITVPFTIYIQRLIKDWVPSPDPQMQQMIELLGEQNRILREEGGLPPDSTPEETRSNAVMPELLDRKNGEMQVLMSITVNSFKDIFRLIGRSANHVSITAGPAREPITSIDPRAVRMIESERRDPELRRLIGVVNSFSRSSKAGIIFSKELGRGIPFVEISEGRLRPQDDYSWSQYTREPIELAGDFVYWFDGRIKQFLVLESLRLPDE